MVKSVQMSKKTQRQLTVEEDGHWQEETTSVEVSCAEEGQSRLPVPQRQGLLAPVRLMLTSEESVTEESATVSAGSICAVHAPKTQRYTQKVMSQTRDPGRAEQEAHPPESARRTSSLTSQE